MSDFQSLLRSELMGLARDVLGGNPDSMLRTYVSQITRDTASLVAITDPTRRAAAQAELLAQLRAVAEVGRIRAQQRAWARWQRVATVVIDKALDKALGA